MYMTDSTERQVNSRVLQITYETTPDVVCQLKGCIHFISRVS